MPQTKGPLKTFLMWQTSKYSQDLSPIFWSVCVLPKPLTFLTLMLNWSNMSHKGIELSE